MIISPHCDPENSNPIFFCIIVQLMMMQHYTKLVTKGWAVQNILPGQTPHEWRDEHTGRQMNFNNCSSNFIKGGLLILLQIFMDNVFSEKVSGNVIYPHVSVVVTMAATCGWLGDKLLCSGYQFNIMYTTVARLCYTLLMIKSLPHCHKKSISNILLPAMQHDTC